MSKTAVCPWWAGYTLNSSLRRLIHKPEKIIGDFLTPDMYAMDIGCGMGYFTLPMANIVGMNGRIIAVDLQQKMLNGVISNSQTAGLEKCIIPVKCDSSSLNISSFKEQIDFALVFMMLHEVPDRRKTIQEIYEVLKPGGQLLFAEPIIHVPKNIYQESLKMFKEAGFSIESSLSVIRCRSVLLRKH